MHDVNAILFLCQLVNRAISPRVAVLRSHHILNPIEWSIKGSLIQLGLMKFQFLGISMFVQNRFSSNGETTGAQGRFIAFLISGFSIQTIGFIRYP